MYYLVNWLVIFSFFKEALGIYYCDLNLLKLGADKLTVRVGTWVSYLVEGRVGGIWIFFKNRYRLHWEWFNVEVFKLH